MNPTDTLAKVTIAAALITSHAVEIPQLPKNGAPNSHDAAALRLRALTDYIYNAITQPE